jgi:hypothetical protein
MEHFISIHFINILLCWLLDQFPFQPLLLSYHSQPTKLDFATNTVSIYFHSYSATYCVVNCLIYSEMRNLEKSVRKGVEEKKSLLYLRRTAIPIAHSNSEKRRNYRTSSSHPLTSSLQFPLNVIKEISSLALKRSFNGLTLSRGLIHTRTRDLDRYMHYHQPVFFLYSAATQS